MDVFMDWLARENFTLENLSFFATLLGVPILLITYITSIIAEGHRREVGTYETLESQYVEFQKLALMNPRLDVADTPLTTPQPLHDGELAQQRTLYMILFSLFERAFLMYRPMIFGELGRALMSRTRRQQWRGWVSYAERYLERTSCREAWFNGEAPKVDVRQDFDDDFERFMMRLMKKKGWV